jgi:hypothetical protein
MRRPKATDYRSLAQEIARDSIVTQATARLIEQIVVEVCAAKDEEVGALRSLLKQARHYVEQMQTSKREAAARAAFELANAIDAVLKETKGSGDD